MKTLTRLTAVTMMAIALAFMFGCMGGNEKELKAQADQILKIGERLAKVEEKVRTVSADVDAVLIDLNNIKESGAGLSPEIVKKIDSLEEKVKTMSGGTAQTAKAKDTTDPNMIGPMPDEGKSGSSEKATETAKKSVKKVATPKKSTESTQVSKPKVTGTYHTVKSGETISSIAQKYGVSVGTIRDKNNLPDNVKLFAGSRLLIPR